MDCTVRDATTEQLSKVDSNATVGVQIDTQCIADRLSKTLDQAGLKYKNNYGTFIVAGIKPGQGQKMLQQSITAASQSSGGLVSGLFSGYKKLILILIVAVLIVAGAFVVYKWKFARGEEAEESVGLFGKIKGWLFKSKSNVVEQEGGGERKLSRSRDRHRHGRHRRSHKRSVEPSASLEYEEELKVEGSE